jgi:Lipocalin-like domain
MTGALWASQIVCSRLEGVQTCACSIPSLFSGPAAGVRSTGCRVTRLDSPPKCFVALAKPLAIGGALMNMQTALGLCAIMSVAIATSPSSSVAQERSLTDQLVGTWIYISSTGKRDDGSIVQRPSLQGAATYTADGRFHFITTRTDAPKYASSDPARPSPDEAMAIASGSVAYTGTYTVDESTKTIHANIETSTFPNLVGAPNQRRIVTSITPDEMRFTNPRTPAGVTLEFVWKRAK